jgi:hypothetical protein
MVGRTISHYQILEKLGEGGMGVVYKARDTHPDRFVAIKVLPPEKVADAERKRRSVQEAKSASALNHPHIITIYNIASDNGIVHLHGVCAGQGAESVDFGQGVGARPHLRWGGVSIGPASNTGIGQGAQAQLASKSGRRGGDRQSIPSGCTNSAQRDSGSD